MDVGSCFFSTQRPSLTSVVFETLHDTLLTTLGRRGFTVHFFFLRWPQMLLTQCDFLRSAPNVKVVRISKQAWANGRSNQDSHGR